jgi:uroporphyrinogen-III synthase
VTRPLDGYTVVVTRPAAQAGPFIEQVRAAGARCIALPTLVIEPLDPGRDVAADILAQPWDWVFYTSVNAVESAAAALGRLPAARAVGAVGRATARALERHGVRVDLRPETANSEGLLAAPELEHVAGRSVLLVKGAGGRDLLRETLAGRGAQVRTLDVYRRSSATLDPAAATAIAAAVHREVGRLVVAVTSAEVLASLLELVPAPLADNLREAGLLVPGARVAAAAKAAGWRGRIVQAETAEDPAMFAALRECVAGAAPSA